MARARKSYNRFPQIIAKLDPTVEAALGAGAELIEDEAKSRVTVASGDLKNAIHTENAGDGVHVVAGDSDVFYGHFVEFGTANTPARPFLIPAAEAKREEVAATVAAALRKL